ncbi:hypothetical protein GPECTOR_646g761 [Gonium pectorale]|uniref:Uncharacterized protein n=1 Tax=Gonium pectorale TaxID=33097 RepID=A0A150FUD3_GONPE|nr:hypothetical protein GPECTOR_646g761 [Gonium pectorale]|eukprot:KXZ41212.1 hypothetical protein GPECTOR_646g761 [Gonium pectorale]
MLDAAGCWLFPQGYPDCIPGYTFGSAPSNTWFLWSDNDCDKRICAFFAAKFGVVPANTGQQPSSWAGMPEKYKPSWRVLGCNTVLGGWSCPAIPGYVGTPGVDHLMDELGFFPYNTSAACTANANCKGFSSAGFIKNASLPNTVRPGACWYSKLIADRCVQVDGFIGVYGMDHSGDDIQNVGSGVFAAALCKADPACLAFNSNGWIKRFGNPNVAASGVCIYRRTPTACPAVDGYEVFSTDAMMYGDIIQSALGDILGQWGPKDTVPPSTAITAAQAKPAAVAAFTPSTFTAAIATTFAASPSTSAAFTPSTFTAAIATTFAASPSTSAASAIAAATTVSPAPATTAALTAAIATATTGSPATSSPAPATLTAVTATVATAASAAATITAAALTAAFTTPATAAHRPSPNRR